MWKKKPTKQSEDGKAVNMIKQSRIKECHIYKWKG